MTDQAPTVQTFVQYVIEYPDPDGDWVAYGRAQNEDDAVEGVVDLRRRTKNPWRVVRQIVTTEVLDA